MTITIYGAAWTRATRCLWAAEELGLDYARSAINPWAGEHDTADFRAINPNAKLPALDHDGFKLFESLAINLYLAKTFGQGSLQPDDAKGEALAAQWSLWVANECEMRLLEALFHTAGLRDRPVSPDKVAEYRAELAAPLAVLNQALEGKDFLLGDRFTVADLNVASVFQWGHAARLDWAPNANIGPWLKRCYGRPSFLAAARLAKAEMPKAS